MRQSLTFLSLDRLSQHYVEDYEYVLKERRKGALHPYDMISPPHGNNDAAEQAEKDFEYERRTKRKKTK